MNIVYLLFCFFSVFGMESHNRIRTVGELCDYLKKISDNTIGIHFIRQNPEGKNILLNCHILYANSIPTGLKGRLTEIFATNPELTYLDFLNFFNCSFIKAVREEREMQKV